MNKIIILSFFSLILCFCQRDESNRSTSPKKISAEEENSKGDEIDLGNIDTSNYKNSQKNFKKNQNIKDSVVSSDIDNLGSAANKMSQGPNQPLYVINGVPIENNRLASAGDWAAKEYKTPMDISPEERRSVKVLSEERAIELYGERGKNGVIIITTKNGKKPGISYIKSSDDSVYTRDDAASLGIEELMRQQNDNRQNNQ